MSNETIKAYKGFSPDMKCRDMQYTVGEEYVHDGKVEACSSGLHSCENPLDVFGYYDPGTSVFCEVEASGEISQHAYDSKVASAKLRVVAKLSVHDMVTRGVAWLLAHVVDSKKESNSGTSSAATNTGTSSAATNTGYRSAATNTGTSSAATNTGDSSAATNTGTSSAATNTGDRSAATNTGTSSAATNTGYRSAATNTGYRSAATNTGYSSAATNTGDSSAATNTGYRSAATNTGYSSAATNTGDSSAASVEGNDSIAIASGKDSKAMASKGSALVLVYRDENWKLVHVWAGVAGRKGIKAGVWYRLNSKGKPVEIKS